MLCCCRGVASSALLCGISNLCRCQVSAKDAVCSYIASSNHPKRVCAQQNACTMLEGWFCMVQAAVGAPATPFAVQTCPSHPRTLLMAPAQQLCPASADQAAHLHMLQSNTGQVSPSAGHAPCRACPLQCTAATWPACVWQPACLFLSPTLCPTARICPRAGCAQQPVLQSLARIWHGRATTGQFAHVLQR